MSAYRCGSCQQDVELRSQADEIDHYCLQTQTKTRLVRISRWAKMREAVEFGRFFTGGSKLHNMLSRAAVRSYYFRDSEGSIFRPATRKHYQSAYREFRKLKENEKSK